MTRNRLASGTAVFVLLVGGTLALGGSARAASCTSYPCDLSDDYVGGIVTYSSPTGDTIETPGTNNFEISSVEIKRTNSGNTLNIAITTNFATISTHNAEGTNYGSVFFGDPPAINPPPANDTYTPGQWTKAFVLDSAVAGTTTNGLGQLYNVGTIATPVPATGVPVSYTTGDGTTNYGSIIMSNFGGNPITFGSPSPGTPAPAYFRQGQAVEYKPDDPDAHKVGVDLNDANKDGSGTWSASGDILTFVINDGGALGDVFSIAWAMTCANDVFQGYVNVPSQQTPPPAPLPGALALMGTVLAGAGGIAKWRKGRKAA